MSKKPNNLDLTKETFEPLYGRLLTDDEAFNVRKNLVSFFEVLIEIDNELKGIQSDEKSNLRSTNSPRKTK
jgi:hypothetical protein